MKKIRAVRRIGAFRNEDGFTFVETLAVLAVGAVLTAGAGTAATKLLAYGRECAARNQLEVFKAALASYYIDCGVFPSDAQGLQALFVRPDSFPVPAGWNGPYVDKKIPADPWGNAYEYYSRADGLLPGDTPEGIPFAIISRGSDGTIGGEGSAKDLVSWE